MPGEIPGSQKVPIGFGGSLASHGPTHRFPNHPTETLIKLDFAEDFLMGYRMDLTREIGSFEPVPSAPAANFRVITDVYVRDPGSLGPR